MELSLHLCRSRGQSVGRRMFYYQVIELTPLLGQGTERGQENSFCQVVPRSTMDTGRTI